MNLSRLRKQIKGEQLARQILGVGTTASAEELRHAWRRRAKELHPDNNEESSEAARRFKIARVAYRCLQGNGDCAQLLEMEGVEEAAGEENGGRENHWAYYLGWKDRFF